MVVADRYKTELDLRRAVSDDPPPGRSPVKVTCLYHEDGATPNLAVYPDGVQCFSCGANRAPLQFLADLSGLDLVVEADAVRALAEQLTGDGPPPKPKAKADPAELQERVEQWCANLTLPKYAPQAMYLLDRGLTLETLTKARIGYTGRAYAVPLYSPWGCLLSVKYRRDDLAEPEAPKYWTHPGMGATVLYHPPPFRWQRSKTDVWSGPVVLTEGELDALLLAQYGVPAVSANNGVSSVLSVLPSLLDGCAGVVLCLDQDEPGRKASSEAWEALTAAGKPAIEVRWNALTAKDVTELFQVGRGEVALAKLRQAYRLVQQGRGR